MNTERLACKYIHFHSHNSGEMPYICIRHVFRVEVEPLNVDKAIKSASTTHPRTRKMLVNTVS